MKLRNVKPERPVRFASGPKRKERRPERAVRVHAFGRVVGIYLLPIGLIIAATLVAFLPARSCGFVNWDDAETVLSNKAVWGLTWPNVRWMLTHYLMGHYQPLALLSLSIDYSLWGLNPFGYHLTSVVFHILNAVLFYLVAMRLLRLWSAERECGGLGGATPKAADFAMISGALAATLLFAIHPLRVESVAWITERRDVLSAFFYLAAIGAYLRAHEAGQPARRTRLWMLVCVLLIMLSLLAKVIAATAAVVFLLLDFYPLRRLGGEQGYWSPAVKRVWLEKLVVALPAIAFIAAAIRAQAAESAWRGMEVSGTLTHVLGGLFGLSFYLWKTILPTGLSPCYEMPLLAAGIDLRFIVAGAGVLALAAPLVIWRRRCRGVLVAWAWYLVLIFPVLGIFQDWPQIAADRYTYLACMSWALLGGAGIYRLASHTAGRRARAILLASMGMAFIALGALTWRQIRVWSDPFTLWERVIVVEPDNCIGHFNYGQALLEGGQTEKAAALFKRATELRPEKAWPWANLGLAFIEMEQLDKALVSLRKALDLDPTDAYAHAGMGEVLSRTGDSRGGMEHLRKAVELRPNDPSIRATFGCCLRQQGQMNHAIDELGTAVNLHPANARYRHELASTLMQAGQCGRAIDVLREGLASTGRDLRLLDELARILAAGPDPVCRHPQEAVRLAEEAYRRRGPSPIALETLAIAYQAAGRRAEADAALRSAISQAEKAGDGQTAQRCRELLARMQRRPS